MLFGRSITEREIDMSDNLYIVYKDGEWVNDPLGSGVPMQMTIEEVMEILKREDFSDISIYKEGAYRTDLSDLM